MAPEAGGALMAAAKGRSQPMTPVRVGELGIVGAGGGGFPTAVKLGTRVPLVIANAAECEPLLHKDKELLHHLSEPFLRGMIAAMEMVGAPQGVIGIKEKYHDIIAAMEQQTPKNIRVAHCCRTPTRRATSSSWSTSSPAASSLPAGCPRTWTRWSPTSRP